MHVFITAGSSILEIPQQPHVLTVPVCTSQNHITQTGIQMDQIVFRLNKEAGVSGLFAPRVCDKLIERKSTKHWTLLFSRVTEGHSKSIDSSYQRPKVTNKAYHLQWCSVSSGLIRCLT